MTATEIKEQAANLPKGKHLTFAISKERYGIDILKVQEIIGLPQITRVPRCPEYIKGVINLRGKIIPLIDLRAKFGLESIPHNQQTCIIVVNVTRGQDKIALGVIVDTVLEVIDFGAHEVERAPDYGTHVNSSFITGMGNRDGALNILIDIEKILTVHETEDAVRVSAGAMQ